MLIILRLNDENKKGYRRYLDHLGSDKILTSLCIQSVETVC